MTSASVESDALEVDRRPGPDPAHVLTGRRIVFDCRWLGFGGAGRVSELLMRRFQAEPPPGRWILWGAEDRVESLAFPGSEVAPWSGDARALAGQRDLRRVPAADVVLYGHQIRPLRPGRSVTVIHDTIPLRHGGTRASRLLKRAFFVAAARLSTQVLTDSEFSRRCIRRDLGVEETRIAVMAFPPDHARAQRVAALRATLGQRDRLVYVGRFAPHKNLGMLCRAFARSGFASRGGSLLMAGGSTREVRDLLRRVEAEAPGQIELRAQLSEEELDLLLATSRALVLPSVEEGFGLPAYEAAASGLPVAASRTGALTELPGERAVLFDPHDMEAMTRAIDEVTGRAALEPLRFDAPFAEVVLGALARAVSGEKAPAR